MNCVLSRSCPVRMNNKKKGKEATRDAPVQACLLNDVDAVNFAIALHDGNAFNCIASVKKNDSDEFYRACIVVLPQAGVFYCHHLECTSTSENPC
jgi:hypothetical protein